MYPLRIGFVLAIIFLINAVLNDSLLFAQKAQLFQIKLEVKNLKVPANVILTVREISQWTEYIDESMNGKFNLSGKHQEPSFAYLVLKYSTALDQGPRTGNIMELFLDEVPVSIVGQDSLRSAEVLGNKLPLNK